MFDQSMTPARVQTEPAIATEPAGSDAAPALPAAEGPFRIRVWKFDQWVYVGPVYATNEFAKSWVPFVRKYWHGMKTQVVSKQKADRENVKAAKGWW